MFYCNFLKKEGGYHLGAQKATVVTQRCDRGSQNHPQRPWAFIWCSRRF